MASKAKLGGGGSVGALFAKDSGVLEKKGMKRRGEK
jgi:hypothetical protein